MILSALVAMFAAHGLMLWLGVCFFRRDPSNSRRRFAWIGSLSTGLTVAFVVLAIATPPPLVVAAAAICAYAVAIVLMRTARAAHRDQPPDYILSGAPPRCIVAAGPYRWVRHPFYLAYSIIWLTGVVLVRGNWMALVGAAVLVGFLVAAAVREEAQFLTSPFAADYRAYQRRTGLLLPAWRRG